MGVGTVVVTAEQVRRTVTPADAVAAVRAGFLALARGEFEMPARAVLADGGFLVMPVHHRPTGTAIVKTLSLAFGSRDPAILGTVTWSDRARTDHLVADAGAVTGLRTGAASGVATDLLAPADASRLTVIGAGAQGVHQVQAVHAVRPLSALVLVDRVRDRAIGLADRLRREFPDLDISASQDVARGVERAQIVCCATTATEPLFAAADLLPDVHVNAIGAFRPSMRELPTGLLAGCDAVHVDSVDAVLEESGEVITAVADGLLHRGDLVEIGDALQTGARRRTGRTVFKSVGVAVQDWAIARLLAERLLP